MRFSTALSILIVSCFMWVLQGYQPVASRISSLKGVIMGDDYTSLLANPTVTFQMEQGPGTVYFVWASENPARIEEILRMGAHIQNAKKDLELKGEGMPDDEKSVRTAKSNDQ